MNNNSKKKYILNVYNTQTGCYEDVEVTEKVYKAYIRSYWNEAKNDKKYYKHNFSLNTENLRERFNEPADKSTDISEMITNKDMCGRLLSCLSETERRRVELHYLYGYEKKEIAIMDKVSVQGVSQSIIGAVKKMKIFYFGL